MGKVSYFAPLAGLLGSLLAVMISVVTEVLQPTFTVERIAAAPFVLIVSLLFTVPACLVLGTPLIYAFRNQLKAHPWRWAPLVTFLGMVLGVICFGWMFTSHTSPAGLLLLLLFSGSSACSFALLYGLRS